MSRCGGDSRSDAAAWSALGRLHWRAGGAATAKPDEPKPKPKPKLELLTATQEAALAKQAIKVAVTSKRGDEARVKATLVVDGFPDDFTFRLGPESKRLRNRKANVRLKLSARQQEVLAFAAQACDEATLGARRAPRKGPGPSTPSCAPRTARPITVRQTAAP